MSRVNLSESQQDQFVDALVELDQPELYDRETCGGGAGHPRDHGAECGESGACDETGMEI